MTPNMQDRHSFVSYYESQVGGAHVWTRDQENKHIQSTTLYILRKKIILHEKAITDGLVEFLIPADGEKYLDQHLTSPSTIQFSNTGRKRGP